MDDQHQKTHDADKSGDASQSRARDRSSEPTAGDAVSQVTTLARNVGEQAWTAAANAGGTAQEMVRQARDQVSNAVAGPGSRAGEYVTRNVNEYPLTALLIAGAVGYGVAYLFHNSWGSSDEPSRSKRDESKR